MKHIDLFSGIGGFSLGFERAGMQTIAFCESDEFCRSVLSHRWPNVPTFADVRDLGGLPVSGPVRSWTTEGIERRKEQPALQPDWIVVENTGHRWRAWVPELRRELFGLGYASLPLRVRASDLGASHERARAFVVANANSELLRELSRWWNGKGRQVAQKLAGSWDSSPGAVGANDGIPSSMDQHTERRHALGNAVVPQVAELIGIGIMAVSSMRLVVHALRTSLP